MLKMIQDSKLGLGRFQNRINSNKCKYRLPRKVSPMIFNSEITQLQCLNKNPLMNNNKLLNNRISFRKLLKDTHAFNKNSKSQVKKSIHK